MLSHLLRFEFRVEDGQLRKHPHVGPLQAEGCLQHGDQLLEIATVLRGADRLKDASRTRKTRQQSKALGRRSFESDPGASYLVVVNEFLQFVSVDDNMKTTHLCKAELFPIHTRETHLRGKSFMFTDNIRTQ